MTGFEFRNWLLDSVNGRHTDPLPTYSIEFIPMGLRVTFDDKTSVDVVIR